MQQVLSHLPNTVFRAKGFVYAAEKPHRRLVLQLVGRRATVLVTGPWDEETPQTRLQRFTVQGSKVDGMKETERPTSNEGRGKAERRKKDKKN